MVILNLTTVKLLLLSKPIENFHTINQTPAAPKTLIFLIATPPPLAQTPRLWLELFLQDFPLKLNANINDQLIALLFQDPHYLDNMVKELINHLAYQLRNQLCI